MLKEDIPSEGLIMMKKPIFWGLLKPSHTNPCCLKVSTLSRAWKMLYHLAKGFQILPMMVWFMKLS